MPQYIYASVHNSRPRCGAASRSSSQGNRLKTKQVEIKTDMVDLFTNVDKAADPLITDMLRSRFPTYKIIAEESARSGPDSPYYWYIDPLDGTTDFAHTYPHFTVSIALAYESKIIVGVVHDPLRNETFCASRNGGAYLNGNSIHVFSAAQRDQSLLLTGFPYDRRARSTFYLRYYGAFMLRTHGVRRSGSAALDLFYVACGRRMASGSGGWTRGILQPAHSWSKKPKAGRVIFPALVSISTVSKRLRQTVTFIRLFLRSCSNSRAIGRAFWRVEAYELRSSTTRPEPTFPACPETLFSNTA